MMMACLLLHLALIPGAGFAQTEPSRILSSSEIASRTKPGTVLLYCEFTAKLTAPSITLNEQRIKQKAEELGGLIRQYIERLGPEERERLLNELNAMSEEQRAEFWQEIAQKYLERLIQDILNSPSDFFLPDANKVYSQDVRLISTGSGFIVTPEGHIVTNAHVVSPDQKELRVNFMKKVLKDWCVKELTDLLRTFNSLREAGYQITLDEAQQEKLIDAVIQFYVENAELRDQKRSVRAVMGILDSADIEKRGRLCDVIKVGETIPGKDIAVLKMAGGSNHLPTLPLQDGRVKHGDRLFVLGYPGSVTFHPTFAPESHLEPSLSQGVVSSIRTMGDGWEVIHTDASVLPGNSGGPVFDETGKVVGIVTFQISDDESGGDAAAFIIPSSVVCQLLADAEVKPNRSLFTIKYNEALEEAHKHYYRSAVELFQDADRLVPGLPYVQQSISDCESAIAAGKDRTWMKRMPLMIGIGTGAFILLSLFLALLIFLLNRRRQPRLSLPNPSG
jgi:S1-C subfamily serine protease